ncbi:MAG: class I SAM-dependent methyltransferase [Sediminibacterium sp.]|jgi:trans-aconitate methyltransferase
MAGLKKYIKRFFEQLQLNGVLKSMHFKGIKTWYYFSNQSFKKANPLLAIPDSNYLFETYQLNYKKYFEQGKLAAKEICLWTEPYLQMEVPTILDWGCGTGRVIQHVHSFAPYALLYGADSNAAMIQWNSKNIVGIHFTGIQPMPPTTYPSNYFNLVFGISVFTHLSKSATIEWIIELHRIIQTDGILLVTTHGSFFMPQLFATEKKQLLATGFFSKSFSVNNNILGDRNDTSYHTQAYFEDLINNYFKLVSFYDGSKHPEKMGGQDLWILQKKIAAK